jgi:hypothetical protein
MASVVATVMLVAACCVAVPSSAVQPGSAAAAKGKCAKGKKSAVAAKVKKGCRKAKKKKKPTPTQPAPEPTPGGPPIVVQPESLFLATYENQGGGMERIQGELTSDPRCASGRTISLHEEQGAVDPLVATVQLVASTNFEFVFSAQDSGDDFYAVATSSTFCSGAVSNTISKP